MLSEGLPSTVEGRLKQCPKAITIGSSFTARQLYDVFALSRSAPTQEGLPQAEEEKPQREAIAFSDIGPWFSDVDFQLQPTPHDSSPHQRPPSQGVNFESFFGRFESKLTP